MDEAKMYEVLGEVIDNSVVVRACYTMAGIHDLDDEDFLIESVRRLFAQVGALEAEALRLMNEAPGPPRRF